MRNLRALLGLSLLLAAAASAQQAPSLFQPIDDGAATRNAPPEELRSRRVAVELPLLGGDGRGAIDSDAPARLSVELFDDVVVELDVIERSSHPRGGYSWRGRPADGTPGEATLIVRDGKVWGNVRLPRGVFQIRPDGALHRVTELDSALLEEGPNDADPPPLDLARSPPPAGRTAASVAVGSPVIDVLVVYSDDARAAAGGTAGIQALIDLGELETNTSYENSDVGQRIRVVHTAEVDYAETGNAFTDRERLRITDDGFIDGVHDLRDTYGADAVSLWLDNSDCGIAYIQTPVSPTFEEFAFSTCALACCTGNLTFGHELGHNMGARHDWFVDNTANSPYSYNHGYTHVGASAAESFRTVMGYVNECNAQFGAGCPRLQYFSNPDVDNAGVPTGVPAGTSTACTTGNTSNPDCDADNAATLDNTAATVAAFRSTKVLVTLAKSVDVVGSQPGDQLVFVGDTLTYTLTATNTSGTTATNVVLQDTVPALTELELGSLTGDAFATGTTAGSTITWTTGESLSSGASLARTFTVTTTAGGDVTNTATVDVDETALTVSSNEVVTRVVTPGLCGFSDGFEAGTLGTEWATLTFAQGRVAVRSDFPRTGTYSAILDDAVADTTGSASFLFLTANLADASGVDLGFYWADGGDEYGDGDGVFLRQGPGGVWTKVFDFTGENDYVWQQASLDLDTAMSNAGLTFGERFQIGFQFVDNFPFVPNNAGSSDGYAIDDIELTCAVTPCQEVLESATVTGIETVETACRILAGPDYTVAATGDLTLRSGVGVTLRSGFSVAAGGTLVVGFYDP